MFSQYSGSSDQRRKHQMHFCISSPKGLSVSPFPGLLAFLKRVLGKEKTVPSANPQWRKCRRGEDWGEWLSTLKPQWEQQSSNKGRTGKPNVHQVTVYKSVTAHRCRLLHLPTYLTVADSEPSRSGERDQQKGSGRQGGERRNQHVLVGIIIVAVYGL